MKNKLSVVLIIIMMSFIALPFRVYAKQKDVNMSSVNISCDSLKGSAQIVSAGNNNENNNNNSDYGGIFDSKKVSKIQAEANQKQEGAAYFNARANSWYEITKVEAYIFDSSSGNYKCGPMVIGDNLSDINDGDVTLKVKIDDYDASLNSDYKIVLKAYTQKRSDGSIGNPFQLSVSPDTINKLLSATSKDDVKKIYKDGDIGGSTAENEGEGDQNTDASSASSDPSSNIDITDVDVYKVKCDDKIRNLINEYWKYVMFLTPLLLIVMMTIDFVKAMSSGDADAIKKCSNDAIKRVIAAVILLALPWALNVVFGWFGLEICF